MNKRVLSLIVSGFLLTQCENKPKAAPEVDQETAPEKVDPEVVKETEPVKVEVEIAKETAPIKSDLTVTKKIDLTFAEPTTENREQLSKVLDDYEARASKIQTAIEDLRDQIFEKKSQESSLFTNQLGTVYALSGTSLAFLLYEVFKIEQLKKQISCVDVWALSPKSKARELNALYKKIDSLIAKARKGTDPMNHAQYKFVGEHVKDIETKATAELERQLGKFPRKSYLGALVVGTVGIAGWIMLYQHHEVSVLVKREEIESLEIFLETKIDKYKKTMEVVDQIRMRMSLPPPPADTPEEQ